MADPSDLNNISLLAAGIAGIAGVAVPDLIGLTQAEAEAAILAAGLSVGAVTQTTVDPQGQMLSWTESLSIIRSPVVEDQYQRIYLAPRGKE